MAYLEFSSSYYVLIFLLQKETYHAFRALSRRFEYPSPIHDLQAIPLLSQPLVHIIKDACHEFFLSTQTLLLCDSLKSYYAIS